MRIQSGSPEFTERLGVILGRLLQAGDLIFLSGDLGAGKTCLVRGIARGLEAGNPVSSPSFALVHLYGGRLPLYHLDLYRLNSPKELEVLDLEELLEEPAVFAIEWGGWIQSIYPEHLEIRISYGENENDRILEFLPGNGRYQSLCEELKRFYEGAGD